MVLHPDAVDAFPALRGEFEKIARPFSDGAGMNSASSPP